MKKTLRILGIRGIPAAHGGFETFAERLAQHLQGQGWHVVVYCQTQGNGPISTDQWCGIERILIPVAGDGALSTMVFDAKAIAHASRFKDLCLTLGYSTALFSGFLRLKGIPNVFNMDGLEWTRAKWGAGAKLWLWLNDWAGCWIGQHLVADHPVIAQHLATRVRDRKITMIPYGADAIVEANPAVLSALNIKPHTYLTLIARPEPENSILDIVRTFSMKPRGCQLLVLGRYDADNRYHRQVKAAASNEVVFLGAIYDVGTLQALRFYSLAYLHGHQVGGTNPSLVEAMGAGNAVIAHDNPFNRWVAGPQALYFSSDTQLDQHLTTVLTQANALSAMRQSSQQRFQDAFTWSQVLGAYENLLERFLPEGVT